MSQLYKYPSIDQFRQVIRTVKDRTYYVGKDEEGNATYDPTRPLPTLTFKGTVKTHGSNAALCLNFDADETWCQSRERIITPLSDNAGFATHIARYQKEFDQLLRDAMFEVVVHQPNQEEYGALAIYGEWCGPGVQKGVAISQLDHKMFIVFGIKLINRDESKPNVWVSDELMNLIVKDDCEMQMYNINTFRTYSIDIDFNHPEIAQDQIIKWTEEVEACCPVGKYFGVEGVGEGIVFVHDTPDDRYMFKAKGEKHSSSKVKTLAAVDIERVNSITELANNIVSENRLEQGITWMNENNHVVCVENTGTFIKWIVGDCLKEELDTIIGSGLEVKEVTPKLSQVAKLWYFAKLNAAAGL